jgi:hypothetical protein
MVRVRVFDAGSLFDTGSTLGGTHIAHRRRLMIQEIVVGCKFSTQPRTDRRLAAALDAEMEVRRSAWTASGKFFCGLRSHPTYTSMRTGVISVATKDPGFGVGRITSGTPFGQRIRKVICVRTVLTGRRPTPGGSALTPASSRLVLRPLSSPVVAPAGSANVDRRECNGCRLGPRR